LVIMNPELTTCLVEQGPEDLVNLLVLVQTQAIYTQEGAFFARVEDLYGIVEGDFQHCDECDRPDACNDFGCASKAGLRKPVF